MAYRGLFVSLVDSVLRANDPEKQKLFFVTYPQYGTPYDLLNTLQESLKAKEHKDDGPAFMNLVGAFLQRWVENCPDDFENDKRLGEDLLSFAREKLSAGITNHLKLKYLRCVAGPTPRAAKQDAAVVSTPFSSVRSKDIACYLTLIDWRYFSAIRATELFDNAWQKPNKNELAPNITALAQRFNTISLWLAESVIDSYGRNAHTAVVEKIIEVLKELFKMNNFSSGMAVLSALNNSSVQRLRNLWTAVRKEHRDLVNHFELFMGMTDNFKNYRRHLRKLQQATSDMTRANRKTPLIPFLALFLRDITFIRDGNSDTKDYQINMEKIELQGRQILQLQEWQRTPFTLNFTRDEAYYKFFEQLVAPTEDQLFRRSQKLQPGTLENVFSAISTPPETLPQQKSEEDTISLGSYVDIRADKLLFNCEYSEVLTEDLSVGEAEDLLRDAGMDNIIDFELDKVQGMLEPSSPQRYLRYLSSESPKLSDSGSFIISSSGSFETNRARSLSMQSVQNVDINTWQFEDVADWLRRVYLSNYIAAFAAAQVDGPQLLQVDHKLLSTFGISSFKDRKMVLTLIEKLKADHGIAVPSRTPSECAVTEPKDVMSEASTASASDATSTAATSGCSSSILSRSRKDSEENDQQVDDIRKRKKRITKSKKGKKTTDVQTERVGQSAEAEPAVPSLDTTTDATPSPPPTTTTTAPTRRPSSLFRNFSKSAVGAAPEAGSAPQVDIGALGGATLVICCEHDKWDCGKLGPVSYDKLVQLILERHGHIFASASEVGVVCAGLKKKGVSVRNDKDLRKVKILTKERNEKIVVFNATKRH